MKIEERELLQKLMTRAIAPEVFIKRFTVDICQSPSYIRELLEEAILSKEANDIEYIMMAVFQFGLYKDEYIGVLCRLMNEKWHFQHENIAMIFQRMKSPKTVDCLFNAALTQFEYLEFDEAFALAVKCIWALGDINTPESREKLKLLAQSENEIISKNAINQLFRNK